MSPMIDLPSSFELATTFDLGSKTEAGTRAATRDKPALQMTTLRPPQAEHRVVTIPTTAIVDDSEVLDPSPINSNDELIFSQRPQQW